MAERAELFVTAEGRSCACGGECCASAYHHCLRHAEGCHLLPACDWKPGMLLCSQVDPNRKGTRRGTLEQFAGSAPEARDA